MVSSKLNFQAVLSVVVLFVDPVLLWVSIVTILPTDLKFSDFCLRNIRLS